MKILELMGMNSTKYGGIEKFNAALAAKSPHKFIFVYFSKPKSDDYIRDLRDNNADVIVIPNNSKLKYISQAIRLIAKERPSVVHFHFDNSKLLIAPIVKILFPKIKQITTWHSEYNSNSRLKIAPFRLLHLCQDRIITVSDGVRQGLINHAIVGGGKKLIVSYLGVKCQVSAKSSKPDFAINRNTLTFTSIGFDEHIKGFDTIADSVKLLSANNYDFKVILVGLNENRTNRYLDRLKSLNIEQYFISLGIRNDVDHILDATDVYLQPSRTEAISLAIMEATHHKLPVIATRVGGIPEIVKDGENGLLVPPSDPQALANAMQTLITNPALRAQFGANSEIISRNFSLDAGVDNLISIYHNL